MWSAMTLLDEARSSLELGRYDEALTLLWLAVERAAAGRDATALEEIHRLVREREDWRPLLERVELHLRELTGRVPTAPTAPTVPAEPSKRRLPVSVWSPVIGLLIGAIALFYVALTISRLSP